MIGKVTFRDQGKAEEVVLEDDGTVRSRGARWQEELERRLADYQYSPSHGPWGVRPLAEFARDVRGTVEWEAKKKPESPDGSPLVY
jgi:hypothetical protein